MKIDDFQTVYKEGLECMVEDEYSEALNKFLEAEKLASGMEEFDKLYSKRGVLYGKMGKWSEALKDFEAVKNVDDCVYYWRAKAEENLQKYSDALEHVKMAIQINGKERYRQLQASLEKFVGEKQASLVGQQQGENVSDAPPVKKVLTLKDKIKYNHYFMGGKVVLSVLGLALIAENQRMVNIVDDETVFIKLQLPDGDVWEKTLKLHGKINVNGVSIRQFKSKVEISMETIGDEDWPRLEKDSGSSYSINDAKRYPSSYAKKDVDWDKLEAQLKKEEKDEEGDGVNSLFQKIYSDADEDTRRAMIKSYWESGGTVLSTDWKNVGNKRVKISPPSNMEVDPVLSGHVKDDDFMKDGDEVFPKESTDLRR